MTEPPALPDEETQRLLQFLYVCPVGLISFADDGTIERINPAAVNLLVAVADLRDHRNVYNLVREAWPDLEDVVRQAAGRVGAIADNHRVRSLPGRPEQWLSLSAVCVAADANMLTISDITSAVLAEQRLVASLSSERLAQERVAFLERSASRIAARLGEADRRHAFLLEVSDAVRDLRDPGQISQTFVTMLGWELGVHRVHYARVADLPGHLVVEKVYTAPDHVGPVPGTRVDMSPSILELLADGTMLAIEDVATDGRLDGDARAGLLALDGASLLLAPRCVDGRVARLLSVANEAPRAWTHHEVTLVEEVADRLWSAERQAAADRDNEARLASIIDTAADSIIVTDARGTIRLANRATTTTFGYPVEELLGRSVTVLMGEAFDEVRGDGRAVRDGALGDSAIVTVSREVEGRRADGSAVPLELAVTEWLDSHGERYVTGILRDITQRKHQLEILARASKLEVAGQLAGGVAHDLNNLLTVIGGNLELAEERVAEPGTHTLLGRALDAVRRGVTFNNRLLSLVHDRPRNVQPLVLADRLDDIASMAQHLLGSEVSLRLVVATDLWSVSVDPGELDSAMLNLARNGRDAITGHGALTIAARNVTLQAGSLPDPSAVPGQYVVLSVRDTGVGMTPEIAMRATEPFFTTKAPGRGTGLGLASVAGFVHSCGGFLVIDSTPSHGTSVSLYLPRGGGEALSAPRPAASPASGGGRRILVVDDDELVRQTTADTVEALGYHVVTAGGGAEAISLLRDDAGVELVLTDVVMPGVDGRELARWIEANRPEVRVVLCSGYTTALGGDDDVPRQYLAKPYSRRQLADTLASLLGSSSRAGARQR